MKNILIVGPSRVGKTSLAKRIGEELNYFVISLDKLVTNFDRAYPQLDIRLDWNRERTTDNIAPFLGHFLGLFSSKGNKFVLEGGYFNFNIILNILKSYGIEEFKDKFLSIGLVQNKKTLDKFIKDFKKYDTKDDWTYNLSDGDLEYVSEDIIKFSKFMTDNLTKYGFTIYDTSNKRECVLNQVMKDIKSKLE